MAKQTPGPWCHFNGFCAGFVFTSTLPNPTPLCVRLPDAATQDVHPPAASVLVPLCGAAVPSRGCGVRGCPLPAWGKMGAGTPGVCVQGGTCCRDLCTRLR